MKTAEEIKAHFHKTGLITEGEYAVAYEIPVFRDLAVKQAPELEFENAKNHGTLVWADEWVFAYKYNGILYITEPTIADQIELMVFEHLNPETAHPESELDRAVREAGFAAEPLTQALERIHDIAGEALGR